LFELLIFTAWLVPALLSGSTPTCRLVWTYDSGLDTHQDGNGRKSS